MGKSAYLQTSRAAIKIFALLSICLITLSACVSLPDPETSQDFAVDEVAVVSPGHSAGQTFVSRRPRLDGITLWFKTESPGTPITLELFHTPVNEAPVFTVTVRSNNGQTHFGIPPQSDPAHQNYFIKLSTQGEIRILGHELLNKGRIVPAKDSVEVVDGLLDDGHSSHHRIVSHGLQGRPLVRKYLRPMSHRVLGIQWMHGLIGRKEFIDLGLLGNCNFAGYVADEIAVMAVELG